MNEWLQILLLSLMQGLTEFLPISSSAHLILLPIIAKFPDQGLAFDVALHFGTLLAVIYYFRFKIKWLIIGFFKGFNLQGKIYFHTKFAWLLILASLPIALGGALLHGYVETIARSPIVIAYATIIFGVLLYIADKINLETKTIRAFSYSNACVIGLMQVLALIPGASRSGITLTGGLFCGFDKKSAATFSFLLAIPTILMAGGYETLKLIHTPIGLPWYYFLLGISLSAISAFLCIHFFLKLINKIGLLPFVVYRIILGAALIYMFQS